MGGALGPGSTSCRFGRVARRASEYHDERRQWVMYAFDPSERANAGIRSREWTAVAKNLSG